MNLISPLLSKLAVAAMSMAVLLVLACGSDPTATLEPTATLSPMPTATYVPPSATPPPPVTPTLAPTPVPPATPTATPTSEPEITMAFVGRSLIPAGAAVIIDGAPAAVLDSGSPLITMLLGLGTAGEADRLDDMVKGFREDSGIDLRQVNYAEMFMPLDSLLVSDISSGMSLETGLEIGDYGIALYGEFSEDDIIATFDDGIEGTETLEYEESTYRGYDVYRFRQDPDADMAVAFASEDTLLIGSNSGVEAMLDVAAKAAPAAPGEPRQTLESLGDRHMGFAMELPPEYLDALMETAGDEVLSEMGLTGALDLTALMSPVSAIKLLLSEDAMEVEAVSLFDDNAAATASKEYSEGIVAMLGAMVASPSLQELVSGMEVTQSGNSVAIEMTVTSATMEQILSFMAMGMMPPLVQN